MSWNRPALVIARWNFFNTTSNRSVSFSMTSIWSFQSEKLEPGNTTSAVAIAQCLPRSTGISTRHRAAALRSPEGSPACTMKSMAARAVVRTPGDVQLSRPMRPRVRPRPRWLLALTVFAATACHHPRAGGATPARSQRDSARVARQPVLVRDTALEQHAARLELKVLEQEAQVEELQTRLDDARREVVRAMAKLQSLATRAEAASGMAEAEIALQALRSAVGGNSQQ